MEETKKLIHELFVTWDRGVDIVELNDEEVFAAGADAIINYLIQHGKL